MDRIAWPSGDTWTIGGLDRTAEELAKSHGIVFQPEMDDLGPLELASFHDPEAGDVVLQYSPAAPMISVDVLVDIGVSRGHALAAVERYLGLSAEDYAWLNQYASRAESLAAMSGKIDAKPDIESDRARYRTAAERRAASMAHGTALVHRATG